MSLQCVVNDSEGWPDWNTRGVCALLSFGDERETVSLDALDSLVWRRDASLCSPVPITTTHYEQAIWAGKKKCFFLEQDGALQTFFHHAPGKELETEIINAYLTSLVKQYTTDSKRGFVVDSDQMASMWQGRQKGLRKVVYPKEKRSLYMDPFGAKSVDREKCRDVTRAFVRQRGVNASRWTCATIEHPLQMDGTSCGALVCKVSLTAHFVLFLSYILITL